MKIDDIDTAAELAEDLNEVDFLTPSVRYTISDNISDTMFELEIEDPDPVHRIRDVLRTHRERIAAKLRDLGVEAPEAPC